MRIVRSLTFLFLIACSKDDTTGATASGVDAEPYALVPKGKVGAVNVFVRPESPGGPLSFSSAGYFLDYSAVKGTPPDGFSRGTSKASDCTKRSAGGCDLVRCTLTADTDFTLANPKYVAAGDITVKRSSGGELKMTPDPQNTYNAAAADPPPAAPGETVTITATGADVPAFSETIPFITAPTPTASRVEVDRGKDAEVAWTGGTNGQVVLAGETGGENDGFIAQLTCKFDAASGKGTIPGGVLVDVSGQELPLGLSVDVTTKTFGGYEVALVADTSADLAQNGVTLVVH